jgi:beta-galactosidase
VFDVTADGKPIVKALDIARQAGGTAKALTRSAAVTVRGGKLDLAFVPAKGDAIVSGIEIVR